LAEAVNQPALLIDADQHAPAQRVANLRREQRRLLGRLDVAPEQDHAARTHLAQHVAQTLVEARARQADEEQPPRLAPQLVGVRCFSPALHRRICT
jgi:hypothetical protein